MKGPREWCLPTLAAAELAGTHENAHPIVMGAACEFVVISGCESWCGWSGTGWHGWCCLATGNGDQATVTEKVAGLRRHVQRQPLPARPEPNTVCLAGVPAVEGVQP